MNFWWKLCVFLMLEVAYGGVVWEVHTWRDGSQETNEIKKEVAVTKEEIKVGGGIDTDFVHTDGKWSQLENSTLLQMEATDAIPIPTTHCKPDTVKLHKLNSIIDTVNSTSGPN